MKDTMNKKSTQKLKQSQSIDIPNTKSSNSEDDHHNNKGKKQDMLTKAKNKLLNLSEALKHRTPSDTTNLNENKRTLTRSMTQCTLDYFFKNNNHHYKKNPETINNNNTNDNYNNKSYLMQKQLSISSYPIQIKVSSSEENACNLETNNNTLTRQRPATVCVDKPSEVLNMRQEALALERPRKKLCFMEPEVNSFNKVTKQKKGLSSPLSSNLKNSKNVSVSNCNILHKTPSFEDEILESQAMRIVRTVGQAFEVCHKLAINSPDHESLGDHEDQDTVTQDLLSDRLSDITSDKPKKDVISDCASDKISLPLDDCNSFKETYVESNNRSNNRATATLQLDIMPPPTTARTTTLSADHGNKKTPLTSTESYPTTYSDSLNYANLAPSLLNGQSTTNISASSCGTSGALSTHHELQLLREQLEQQNQQTKATMAQLQLTREQLAAEQTARLEAQARTHQLLVHNRELLDHIAALVAHLQGGDKTSGQQQTAPHMTMPQHSQATDHQHQFFQAPDQPTPLDLPTLYQHLGLIENRAVTSPLRNSTTGLFNFHNIPQPQSMETCSSNNAATLETQLLLQRIQQSMNQNYMSSFTQPTLPPCLTQSLLNQALFNSTIQNKGYATLPRTFGGSSASNNPGLGNIMINNRNSEPRQTQNSNNGLLNNLPDQFYFSERENSLQVQNNLQRDVSVSLRLQRRASFNPTLQGQEINHPGPEKTEISPRKDDNNSPTTQFIKPISQIGTLTTTDADGRVRVIVPVPSSSSSSDDHNNMLANLRLSDDYRSFNGPGPITRSTSERVPNRSELMSEVHRTAWARHTTK